MKNQTFYNYLGKISIIVTPLAAAIIFGWWSYEAAYTITAVTGLSIVAGLSMAIALEGIGMMAGHIASDLYQQKDKRWLLAAFIMIIYVCVGLYELKGTSIAVVFLLSPLIYILVAMQHTVGEEKAVTTAATEDDTAWKRQIELQEKQWRHDEKMARIEAKTARQDVSKTRQDTGKLPPNTPQHTGNIPADWRQVTTGQRHELAHLTREERNEILPELAARTRRQWHTRLDDIAAQNGTYKEKN